MNKLEKINEIENKDTFKSKTENVEDYKKDKLKSVKSDASDTLEQGDNHIKSITSTGYTENEINQKIKEKGLDKKLEDIHNKTKQLEDKTNKQIKETHGISSTGVSEGLNFVPVVGEVKMIAEAGVGKTMDGNKLSGKERLVYAGVGVTSLALDAFGGSGEVEKDVFLSGKGAAALEKASEKMMARGAEGSSKLLSKTGKVLKENPETTGAIENYTKNKAREKINKVKKGEE